MNSIFKYIIERFPVPSALLFSFGYAFLAIGLSFKSNVWKLEFKFSFIELILLASVFFFFLLRQRAIDEFRDAEHDKVHFPNRPVPRGLVSKKQIIFIGFFAFSIEILSAFMIGRQVFILYLAFLTYSLLLAKELFIPHWLNKHFTIYFIIHEFIFFLIGLFFVSALNPDLTSFNLQMIFILIVLTAAPMGIEVIRKFKPRHNNLGKVVLDTYSSVWGRSNAFLLLIVLSLIVGIGLTILKSSSIFLLFSFLIIFIWILFGRNSDKVVIIIGAINFLGFAILANIIW